MADVERLSKSPAYAVFTFPPRSDDDAADEEQQQLLVEQLEKAGVIQRKHANSVIEIAPATREAQDAKDDEDGGHGSRTHSHGNLDDVPERDERAQENGDEARGDADKADDQVVILNSGTVPNAAIRDLVEQEVGLAFEATADIDKLINRDVVSIEIDEESLERSKVKVLAGLRQAGFEVMEVHDGADITTRLREKVRGGYETAFYILDIDVILRKYKQWRKLLPRVGIRYAVKCSPDPVLLKTLSVLGTGFDVASQAETQLALELGTPPEKIIYANPCKPLSHIAFARDKNVKLMTFDNDAELHKIKKIFPDAELVLRILPPNNQAAVCNFGSKFGAYFGDCGPLARLARELGLKIVGVSFHVGSGCFTVKAYELALRQARTVFDLCIKEGFDMRLLDIGGGFPGSDEGALSFAEITDCVRPLIDELFPPSVDVIAEPGRYFAAECMTLAANIVSRRVKRSYINEVGDEVETEPSYMYYISDGLYGSMNMIFYDHAQPRPSVLLKQETDLSEEQQRKEHKSTVFGPTCDSIDCICTDIDMPELQVGDWLFFANMGAYSKAAGSQFNGFELPKVFYICSY